MIPFPNTSIQLVDAECIQLLLYYCCYYYYKLVYFSQKLDFICGAPTKLHSILQNMKTKSISTVWMIGKPINVTRLSSDSWSGWRAFVQNKPDVDPGDVIKLLCHQSSQTPCALQCSLNTKWFPMHNSTDPNPDFVDGNPNKNIDNDQRKGWKQQSKPTLQDSLESFDISLRP